MHSTVIIDIQEVGSSKIVRELFTGVKVESIFDVSHKCHEYVKEKYPSNDVEIGSTEELQNDAGQTNYHVTLRLKEKVQLESLTDLVEELNEMNMG